MAQSVFCNRNRFLGIPRIQGKMIFIYNGHVFQQLQSSNNILGAQFEIRLMNNRKFSRTHDRTASMTLGKTLKQDHITEKLRCEAEISHFASLLRKYGNLRMLAEGRQIHDHIIKHGLEGNRFLGNLLVQMYGKCGALEHAREHFENMCVRNSYTWNLMITAYLQHGNLKEASEIFNRMPDKDVISWTAIITAYTQQGQVKEALQLFHKMPQRDVVAWNAIIAAQIQQGQLEEALQMFKQMPERDVATWNTIMAGFVQHGRLEEARETFQQMPVHNVISWTTMVAGYAQSGKPEEALHFFEQMPERNVVSWTAMILAYAQDGQVEKALQVFQQMPEKNVVSWTTMISAYAEDGQFYEALKLFQQMQLNRVMPEKPTYIVIIGACTSQASLTEGKLVHDQIVNRGLDMDLVVGNAILNMYGKCGCLIDALLVFNKMSDRNLVTWNVMLSIHAQHGEGLEAIQRFHQMLLEGIGPDEITFVSVLSACGNAAIIHEGCHYLICMTYDFSIKPTLEHYTCLIDHFGRIGCLAESEDMVESMLSQPDATSWTTLLGSCATYVDTERGKRVAKRVLELDPGNASAYVTLSNIYTAAGHWEEALKIRKLIEINDGQSFFNM